MFPKYLRCTLNHELAGNTHCFRRRGLLNIPSPVMQPAAIRQAPPPLPLHAQLVRHVRLGRAMTSLRVCGGDRLRHGRPYRSPSLSSRAICSSVFSSPAPACAFKCFCYMRAIYPCTPASKMSETSVWSAAKSAAISFIENYIPRSPRRLLCFLLGHSCGWSFAIVNFLVKNVA